MTYKELKQKQQEEVNNFPLGFAFNDKQFEEMMSNWGLTTSAEDLHKIVSLGVGSYMRKQDIKAFEEMCDRHQKERQNLFKQEKELIDALVYQLHNHEYGYSRSDDDIEAALEALGLSWEDVNAKTNPFNHNCLKQALERCSNEAN